MNTSLVALTLLSTFLFTSIDLTKSVCCGVPLKCTKESKTVETCYDCTESTPHCGKGPCNIFGCNFDAGCRAGDSSLWCWNIASKCDGKFIYQEAGNYTVNEFFDFIDSDSDEKVCFNEAKNYLDKYEPKNTDMPKKFDKLDKNKDGFLVWEEIDGY